MNKSMIFAACLAVSAVPLSTMVQAAPELTKEEVFELLDEATQTAIIENKEAHAALVAAYKEELAEIDPEDTDAIQALRDSYAAAFEELRDDRQANHEAVREQLAEAGYDLPERSERDKGHRGKGGHGGAEGGSRGGEGRGGEA